MGFEVQEQVAKLVFDDPSFGGLEVRCALIPLDELAAAASLADIDPSTVTAADMAKVTQIRDAFAAKLRGWNLTRGGKAIPATLAGVKSLDLVFVLQLIGPWIAMSAEIIANEQKQRAEIEAQLPSLPAESL